MPNAEAAVTHFDLLNGMGTELRGFDGTPLNGGAGNVGNDGTILQLGYYTLATPENPFVGVWIPLSGEGSGNIMNSTIGDKGMPSGRFSFSLAFADSNPNIPLTPLPMTIRFYDATSISSAAYYNAVSNASGLWNWVTPTALNPLVTISLADAGIVWQDGTASAFRTTIAIPEISPAIFVAFASGLLAFRRVR